MDRALPVLILALVFLAALGLMALGWRRRGRSQAHLPAPDTASSLADLGEDTEIGPVPAIYVDTVLAGTPLERVVAHGLGTRSKATLARGAVGSWRIERQGARTSPSPPPTSTPSAPPGRWPARPSAATACW